MVMYWNPVIETDGGMLLAVMFRFDADGTPMVQEFAGRGRTVAEAKSKAIALSWRQSRIANGLPEEHAGHARASTRPASAADV